MTAEHDDLWIPKQRGRRRLRSWVLGSSYRSTLILVKSFQPRWIASDTPLGRVLELLV